MTMLDTPELVLPIQTELRQTKKVKPQQKVKRTPPKALIDLNECDCRWPVVDAPRYLFCGEPKVEGLPYCPIHSRIAYTKTPAHQAGGVRLHPLRAFQK